MTSEFDLIRQYFTRTPTHTDLSVGDDAALICPASGFQLAVSTDMLVAGTHFFHNAAPYDIGWKALAVNVSDMAAMGAQPKWATLALALPGILPSPSQGEGQDGGEIFASTPTLALPLKEGGSITEAWLSEFSRGFFACADQFDIDLIGGDTTQGPLNVCVTIFGETPIGKALRRDGAQIGDDIWVSGQLGSAALALRHLQGKTLLETDALEANINALLRPMPRVALGLKLHDIASSCIDISDGLAADLGHILTASKVGAEIVIEKIPHAPEANKYAGFEACMLSGGDDYELCFTAPATQRDNILAIGHALHLKLSCIGQITQTSGLSIYTQDHQLIALEKSGYDHFA